jgi:hypothetical protein
MESGDRLGNLANIVVWRDRAPGLSEKAVTLSPRFHHWIKKRKNFFVQRLDKEGWTHEDYGKEELSRCNWVQPTSILRELLRIFS